MQIFIMGDFTGIGVQGSVYRYQTSIYGTYFFPITREIVFVLNGTYFGRTALSVLLWVLGTVLLGCTTIFAFLHVNDTKKNYFRQIICYLIVSCVIYLGSCIAQYGFFFKGMSGISFPVGIIAILCWIGVLRYYWKVSAKIQDMA